MADTAEFAIGAEASATDGPVGKVSRVVVDPVAKALTHLVVEPGLRHGPSRLVPLDLVDGGGASEVRLSCTKAEFENLEPAEETKFVPRTTSYGSFGAGDVLSWPYYGAGGVGDLDGIGGAGGMGAEDGSPVPRKITYDTVPVGEVGVRRGQPVLATDGAIGHVQGLVVHPDTRSRDPRAAAGGPPVGEEGSGHPDQRGGHHGRRHPAQDRQAGRGESAAGGHLPPRVKPRSEGERRRLSEAFSCCYPVE